MQRTLLISLAGIAFGMLASGQTDSRELVRQSIQNYQRDWGAARSAWRYVQTDNTESDGEKSVEVVEVVPLCGTPYERLIRKDGRPLTPAEQRKEDRKFERAKRQREKETPAEREARIRKYESERAFVREVPDAYNFRIVREELVEGRSAWVVSMAPRPEFVPATAHGAMLEHIEGTLWIDKEDVQWAKAEAHVTATIGIGWILARIEPGTRFAVEQTRVENGLWMPRRITISGAAHVMLVHTKNIREELTYSGYRKDDGAETVATAQSPSK